MKRLMILILLLCLLLTACSYYRFEDSIKRKLSEEIGKNRQENRENGESAQNIDEKYRYSEGVFHIGDVIPFDIWGKMELTVNSAKVFDSMSDAGIDKTRLHSEEVKEDGSNYFVLLDLTIKNIDASGLGNDGEDFYIDGVLIERDYIGYQDSLVSYFPIAYFSHSPSREDADWKKNYYKYTLSKGESLDCQIGFFVPRELVKNNEVVYCLGANTNIIRYYVELDLEVMR